MCPYCYHKYTIASLKMFCKQCNKIISSDRLGMTSKMFYKLGKLPKIKKCPLCGTTKKSNIIFKCNNCDHELSRNLIELNNKIISIVGGRGSGKTTYVALLIDELKKNIKFGDGRTLKIANNDNRKKDVISEIQDRIKINKVLPDATEPRELKSEDSTAGLPLTYFYKGNSGAAIALSFYDSSGEDLQNYDAFQKEYDYIRNTSGIIFMMDIFSDKDNLRNTEYSLINLIKLLQLENGLSVYSKISIPVSFVLNKFDLYASTGDRHINWNGANDETILEIIDSVHETLLTYFKDHAKENLGNILQICDDNFKTYRFIPVSSLGFNPESDSIIEKQIMAFDIEYPYVYLLNNIN